MLCIKCKKEIAEGSAFCNWCGKKQTVSAHAPKRRGNGEGTVFRKPCGTWRAEYIEKYIIEDGKKKRITKTKSGFKTKKDALEYLATMKVAPKAETKKVREIYEIIKVRELDELSKDKQSHYRTAYNRMQDIENINISELTLEDLQALIDSIDTGFYPKRDVKNLLNKIYEYALIEDYCKKNLAQYIKLPKNQKSEKIIFTKDEIQKLWESWNSDREVMAGYLLVMIHSGIRTGELRNIVTENIDIDNQIMYGGIKTEKGKRRPIIIIDKIKPIIEHFLNMDTVKLCEYSEYMFYKKWNELRSKLDLRNELDPNCSRHTCATALAEANIPPAVIMDILGHEKYDTSLNYTHINISKLKESLEKSL